VSDHEDNQLDGLLSEEEIRSRMAAALAKVAAYQREADGWRLILRGRRAVVGHESGEDSSEVQGHPGNKAAVLRVLADAPTRVWAVRDLYDELEDRGWLPKATDPRKSLGATLSTMTADGILERVGRASYRLSPAQLHLVDGGALD
jgi:hypothetical protein